MEAFEAAAAAAGAVDEAASTEEATVLVPELAASLSATAYLYDDEGNVEEEIPVTYASYLEAAAVEEPDPAAYGVWVPGIPVLISSGLTAVHCADWLQGLILDGIVGGVGAVLGLSLIHICSRTSSPSPSAGRRSSRPRDGVSTLWRTDGAADRNRRPARPYSALRLRISCSESG